jgi:hypothetical protein
MGKAFEAQVKTATNEHKGKEDKNGPDYGRLSAAAIALPTGLNGVNSCTDGKVIFGDLQEMIHQNRETQIVLNDTIRIGQNHSETIEKTSTNIIKMGRESMVGVYDTTEIQGDRTLWVHGDDKEHYLIHREIDEPVEKFEHKKFCLEYGSTSMEAMASAFETKGFSFALENMKVEAKMFKQTNELIEGKMDAITGKAEGMDVALGLLMLKGKYTFNALCNWAMSSPTS